MAKIKGSASQTTSVERVSEGAEVYLRMLRDGSVGIADLIAMWSLEGRVFTCNGGTDTSAITFGAGTLDLTEFDVHVAIPASVVVIPLELDITFDTMGTAQIVECMMQYGTGSVVGTATASTPISSNPSSGIASACTVKVASATGTALTTVTSEIWHAGVPLGITIATVGQVRVDHTFRYRAMESGILHVIGPSMQIAIFAAAQAGVGFVTLKYAELPLASVK